MRTILLIARRYLFSRGSHSVVNIISMLSLLSLLFPVAAIIILLSIFNGFGSMVEGMGAASEGDLTIRLSRGKLFEQREIDLSALRQIEGVEALSFVTEQTLLLERESHAVVAVVRGVDQEYDEVVKINDFVGVGDFRVEDGSEDLIVLSGSMPYALGITHLMSSEVTLYSLRTGRLQSFIPTATYSDESVGIGGVVYVDMEHDEKFAYTSNRLVNRLLGRDSVASKVVVRIADDRSLGLIREDIESVVGTDFEVVSRYEMNAALYEVIRYEKWGIMVIALLVLVLATFSLMGALTMLVVERQRDITTLAMLGLSRQRVRMIFVSLGGIIGLIAIAGGLVLGLSIALVQQHFGLLKLPVTATAAIAYPVEVQMGDILFVIAIAAGVTVGLSALVVRMLINDK